MNHGIGIRWTDTSRNFPKVGNLENLSAPRTIEQARADIARERDRRAPRANTGAVTQEFQQGATA